MSAKLSSKKKILIAASLLGIFLIGAIVSIVLVLAASTQGVSSNITVSYNAEGVAAKVSATYAKVPLDTSATVTKTAMTTSGGGQEITFNISNSQTTESISPAGDIELDPQNQKVVFEYVFENLAETAFSISLTQRPTGTNMTETFYVSGTRLSEGDYRTRITKTTLAPQAITSLGQKVYIYIMASVTNENLKAGYNGGFAWELKAQNTIDITLNTDGATSTLKVIPNTITGLEEIAMPVLNTMPTKTDYNFGGYYTEDDTQYINGFGISAHIADLAENTVLYADWNQEELVIEDNVVYGLTDVGKTATSVEIPEGTRAIGDSALSGSSVTSVTIPNSVETIGNNAFYNSTNLETVTIGDSAQTASYADGSSLKSIGISAFSGCSSLTSIVIPSTVKSIGNNAFQNCTKLESIEFPYVLGNGSSSYSSAFSKLFGGGFPYSLTTVVINGGTRIGDYAFINCGLTNINIPSSVTSIGNSAFYSCSRLKSITFAENSRLTSIGELAFTTCTGLTSITIPSSVTSIGSDAFRDSSGLTSVTFAENSKLTSIGSYAFGYLYGLTSITIPSSVTSIGRSAFASCRSVISIVVEAGNRVYNSGNGSNCIIETATNKLIQGCNTTTIPSGVTSIGDSAFEGCSGLTSVSIPESLTSIGTNAFSDCDSLEYNIYGNAKYLGNSENPYVVLIKATSTSITSCEINANTKIIYGYAFYNCKSLTSVTIPSSVTSIGHRAFYNCSSLTNINIPSGVTSIGDYAFQDCSKLTSVTFENTSGWGAYSGTTFRYAFTPTTASTNATNLKNTAYSSSSTTNWGYYILKRT